jgi:hypothetical protein
MQREAGRGKVKEVRRGKTANTRSARSYARQGVHNDIGLRGVCMAEGSEAISAAVQYTAVDVTPTKEKKKKILFIASTGTMCTFDHLTCYSRVAIEGDERER